MPKLNKRFFMRNSTVLFSIALTFFVDIASPNSPCLVTKCFAAAVSAWSTLYAKFFQVTYVFIFHSNVHYVCVLRGQVSIFQILQHCPNSSTAKPTNQPTNYSQPTWEVEYNNKSNLRWWISNELMQLTEWFANNRKCVGRVQGSLFYWIIKKIMYSCVSQYFSSNRLPPIP